MLKKQKDFEIFLTKHLFILPATADNRPFLTDQKDDEKTALNTFRTPKKEFNDNFKPSNVSWTQKEDLKKAENREFTFLIFRVEREQKPCD